MQISHTQPVLHHHVSGFQTKARRNENTRRGPRQSHIAHTLNCFRSHIAHRFLGHGDLRPVEMNNAEEFSDTVFNCSADDKTEARLIRRS